MTGKTTERTFTTYYDAACPVCAAEIRGYRRYAGRLGLALEWVDVDHHGDALNQAGLCQDDLRRRLHAVTPDGRLFSGIDAFAQLWDRMPRYRWLARLVRLPGGRALAWLVYEGVIAPIAYRWARARTENAAAPSDNRPGRAAPVAQSTSTVRAGANDDARGAMSDGGRA